MRKPHLRPTPLVLATRNPDKALELKAILVNIPFEIIPCPSEAPEVIEDSLTLAGNAEKKARTLYDFTGLATLADDTGLEVDALGGLPGVRSARFAGEHASYADNRALLCRKVAGLKNRTARFRTAIAFIDVSGALHIFEGKCEGSILYTGRGLGGYGYDSLFVPEGFQRTFAEITQEEKNSISHRRHALNKFVKWIEREGKST